MNRINHLFGVATLMLATLHSPLTANEPVSQPARNPALPLEFVQKTLTLGEEKTEWKYVVYVPPQYDNAPEHKWPVILFLHGSGEIGVDGVKHTNVGLPRHIRGRLDRFPFIVVMPQAHNMWFRGANAAAAWAALDKTLREYRVDRDRVYLTGLSMGGFAAWEMAILQPDVFAAVIPVCGQAPNAYLSNMVNIPVWAFHGAKDPNVPVEGSRSAIKSLKSLGASPRYTEYPEGRHKIWDRVYSSEELWRWVLEQRRAAPPKSIDYRLVTNVARVWWLTARADPAEIQNARIRATVSSDHTLHVETRGVPSWMVISRGEPLKPGEPLKVMLNGETVFDGKFTGAIGYNVAAAQPTTAPADDASEPEIPRE